MANKSLQYIRDFAWYRHNVFANQKYDNDYPYSLHLNAVRAQAKKWAYLLPAAGDLYEAEAGAYLHDTLEDARLTYNELKDEFGVSIANIVWGCTESAGRTRDERHDATYFLRLKSHYLNVYVKLCDLMANSCYGLMTASGMFNRQQKEWPKFKEETAQYTEMYEPMYKFLDKLYENS